MEDFTELKDAQEWWDSLTPIEKQKHVDVVLFYNHPLTYKSIATKDIIRLYEWSQANNQVY